MARLRAAITVVLPDSTAGTLDAVPAALDHIGFEVARLEEFTRKLESSTCRLMSYLLIE